jgi:hypothetical protein
LRQTLYADMVDHSWLSSDAELLRVSGSPYMRSIIGREYSYLMVPIADGQRAMDISLGPNADDVRDRATLDRVFAAHRLDAVMHLVAETHVNRSFDGPGHFRPHPPSSGQMPDNVPGPKARLS